VRHRGGDGAEVLGQIGGWVTGRVANLWRPERVNEDPLQEREQVRVVMDREQPVERPRPVLAADGAVLLGLVEQLGEAGGELDRRVGGLGRDTSLALALTSCGSVVFPPLPPFPAPATVNP
jgi:hypothetical protein